MEHLARRYDADQVPILEAILDAASGPLGASEEALVAAALAAGAGDRVQARDLLLRLVDAWYLDVEAGLYRFSLPLFRLWWERFGVRRG